MPPRNECPAFIQYLMERLELDSQTVKIVKISFLVAVLVYLLMFLNSFWVRKMNCCESCSACQSVSNDMLAAFDPNINIDTKGLNKGKKSKDHQKSKTIPSEALDAKTATKKKDKPADVKKKSSTGKCPLWSKITRYRTAKKAANKTTGEETGKTNQIESSKSISSVPSGECRKCVERGEKCLHVCPIANQIN